MGRVLIKGDVVGGAGDYSGMVHSLASIASVKILGSIIGGPSAGIDSGIVYTYEAADGLGNIGNVFVGGSLIGNTSQVSGSIYSGDKAGECHDRRLTQEAGRLGPTVAASRLRPAWVTS